MKGQFPEDIGWTLIVLIVVIFFTVVFLIYALLVVRTPFIGKGPISYSLEFVKISNRPYLTAEVLSRYMIGDRQFIEHAIESAFVGSMENASSDIGREVDYFMKHYKFLVVFNHYIIIIRNTDENIIFSADNMYPSCADDKGHKGVCISLAREEHYDPVGTRCGMGADEVVDVTGACKPVDVCCVYYEKDDGYFRSTINSSKFAVACGHPEKPGKIGVCDKAATLNLLIKKFQICKYGKERIEEEEINGQEECEVINPKGDTPICCTTPELLTKEGIFSSRADVPLLYKGGIGYLEVMVDV
jgi:hypothetical protein